MIIIFRDRLITERASFPAGPSLILSTGPLRGAVMVHQEPLFIFYANQSIYDNFDNFFAIAEKISSKGYRVYNSKCEILQLGDYARYFDPGMIITRIISAIKQLNSRNVETLYKAYRSISEDIQKIANEAKWGWENSYCFTLKEDEMGGWWESPCRQLLPGRWELVKSEAPEDRCSCYSCEQKYFQKALSLVSKRYPLAEIPGFRRYLETYRKWESSLLTSESEKIWNSPFQDYNSGWISGPDPQFPNKHIFNEFVRSFIAHSFVEFMEKEDIKAIKQCPYCNNFFIARDLKKTRCYSKACDKAYSREKKRKQRKNNPAKYI
jgi:hypothetical protein